MRTRLCVVVRNDHDYCTSFTGNTSANTTLSLRGTPLLKLRAAETEFHRIKTLCTKILHEYEKTALNMLIISATKKNTLRQIVTSRGPKYHGVSGNMLPNNLCTASVQISPVASMPPTLRQQGFLASLWQWHASPLPSVALPKFQLPASSPSFAETRLGAEKVGR